MSTNNTLFVIYSTVCAVDATHIDIMLHQEGQPTTHRVATLPREDDALVKTVVASIERTLDALGVEWLDACGMTDEQIECAVNGYRGAEFERMLHDQKVFDEFA